MVIGKTNQYATLTKEISKDHSALVNVSLRNMNSSGAFMRFFSRKIRVEKIQTSQQKEMKNILHNLFLKNKLGS